MAVENLRKHIKKSIKKHKSEILLFRFIYYCLQNFIKSEETKYMDK